MGNGNHKSVRTSFDSKLRWPGAWDLEVFRTGLEVPRMPSHRLERLAGQEGWFTPACLAMGVGGDKPPFLTCEFKEPERFSHMLVKGRLHLLDQSRLHIEACNAMVKIKTAAKIF